MKVDLSIPGARWTAREKILRGLWKFVVQPIVSLLPKSMSPIRILALRIAGARIGKRCLVMPGVNVLMPWNLILGDYVVIGRSVEIYNFSMTTVGDSSIVSQDCFICTGSHDYSRTNLPLVHSPISIGSCVWIAARVLVLPGVVVADGVVIGMGSVVTKSIIQPWSIYAGNPAKFIRSRNEQ